MVKGYSYVEESEEAVAESRPPFVKEHNLNTGDKVMIITQTSKLTEAGLSGGALGTIIKIEAHPNHRNYGVAVRMDGTQKQVLFDFGDVVPELSSSGNKVKPEKKARENKKRAAPPAASTTTTSPAMPHLPALQSLTSVEINELNTQVLLHLWNAFTWLQERPEVSPWSKGSKTKAVSEKFLCLRDVGEVLDQNTFKTTKSFEKAVLKMFDALSSFPAIASKTSDARAEFTGIMENPLLWWEEKQNKIVSQPKSKTASKASTKAAPKSKGSAAEPKKKKLKVEKNEKKQASSSAEQESQKVEKKPRPKKADPPKKPEPKKRQEPKKPEPKKVKYPRQTEIYYAPKDEKTRISSEQAAIYNSNALLNLAVFIGNIAGGNREEIEKEWHATSRYYPNLSRRDYYFHKKGINGTFRSKIQVGKYLKLIAGELEKHCNVGRSRRAKKSVKKQGQDEPLFVERVIEAKVMPGEELGLHVLWQGFGPDAASIEPYELIGDQGARYILDLANEDIDTLEAPLPTLVKKAKKWAFDFLVTNEEEFEGRDDVPFEFGKDRQGYVGLNVRVYFGNKDYRDGVVTEYGDDGDDYDAPFFKVSLDGNDGQMEELEFSELIDSWREMHCRSEEEEEEKEDGEEKTSKA
jgi:hypothetical protein